MTIEVRIKRITYRTEGINSFELVPVGAQDLPPFTAGAHIELHLGNGMRRAYSLHNRPGETHRYEIAVQREPGGRGGSAYIHERLRVGEVITISGPVNAFELVETASHYILIGGGIGITPIIAMATRLREIGASAALHYCGRRSDMLAFLEEALALGPEISADFHIDGGVPANGFDPGRVLAGHVPGTSVYCCGPTGLMNAVRAATHHWPAGSVRFESFAPPPLPQVAPDDRSSDFEIEVESSGQVIPVRPDQTILEALRARGMQLDSSCEAGTCAVCKTRYLEGQVDHQDFVLTNDEQDSYLMLCVSRAKSRRLKLAI